jgi:circadian clock protein KaiB
MAREWFICRDKGCGAPPTRNARTIRACPVTNPVIRLYVAGTSATARRAEKQLADLQAHIRPEWKVEVIDVQQRPELAERAGILATPTLAYEHTDRSRRIVGDLGDTKRVLEFLGIELKGKSA